jgi:hypothetical protein
MDDRGEFNLCFTPALTFYPLPQERKSLQADSGCADDRPAHPVARIFKKAADDSPSPWGEGRDEGGRKPKIDRSRAKSDEGGRESRPLCDRLRRVTCNRTLRLELARACEREGFELRLAEKSLCTDNAAMIGILAERKFLHKVPATDLDSEIQPGWVLV